MVLRERGKGMDLNLVVLCGRLAAPPEVAHRETEAPLVRWLITVREEEPRRVDVIAVEQWNPPADLLAAIDAGEAAPGTPVWACGSVQRRYTETPIGERRSRVQVVADQVCLRATGDAATESAGQAT